MDNSGTVMIGEEDYEVVDECTGEEEALEETQEPQTSATDCERSADAVQQLDSVGEKSDSIVQQRSGDDVVTASDSVIQQLDSTQKDCEINDDKNSDNEMSDPVKVNDSIDFTADINLDQLDTQKDLTDEDVMNHLDVIENIELDHETFGIKQPVANINHSESFINRIMQKQDEEVTVIDKAIDEKWYEKKITEKETVVRERLSKLARVLGISYPHYEKWLERIEKKEGSPMCILEPIRRCSLDKPHTNRWKFECIKREIQEVCVKEEGNSDSTNVTSKTVWHLEPTGTWSVNTNNISEFPLFVLKAVKIFEEFLQTTIAPNEDATLSDNAATSTAGADSKKNAAQARKQQWLRLLVRCNSMDELMLFATGKNISRDTMDRLKQTYETGPGKDCNVRSLYCKSMNKCADKVITNTTFLVGAEALDEVVGGLKVQLSPKTNFWSNAAGAMNVAKAVMDMLKPTPKVTVLEIGCGIGMIGLMMASKCREVIEVDTRSEIEDAEMTCELNKITNVSFIVGYPSDVVNEINKAVKNRITYAIVNVNTNMGRAVEVMTCLRKLTSLRRIVMVTTLTKQSVRAILELARPIEDGLGHPFMPTRACVVDTLPIGPHFETIILMEPRLMHRLTQSWFLKKLEEESKSLENTKALEKELNSCGIGNADTLRKNPLANMELVNKNKSTFTKKTSPVKSGSSSPIKGKMKKREHSPEIIEIPKKILKKYEKTSFKSWQQDITAKKKKNWLHESSALRINPLYDKKSRDKERIDLREKLSSNKIDNDLVQKVNESREILEAAKEKLSGPSPKVDATTAKELQNVLSLVLEQTNKIQTQVLSRSVWDRIAPPETTQNAAQVSKGLDDDPLLKGRFVQETRAQDIVITTANKEYLETDDNKAKPPFRKYHNLAPLEPDIEMPVTSTKLKLIDKAESHQKSFVNRSRQQSQVNSWERSKDFNKSRWNDAGGKRKASPPRRQESYKHRVSSPRKFSPKRPLLSPPRRPSSPPRRHVSSDRSSSPYQVHDSHSQREYSLQRRLTLSSRHVISGGRHQITSPERPFSLSNRATSPSRRPMSPSNRSMSPMRQQTTWRQSPSPSRRQISPMRTYNSTRQISPMKRPMSPMRHNRMMSPMRHRMSPERRNMSPIGKLTSPSRSRGVMPTRRQSPMRRSPPHRISSGRSASPARGQISPPDHQSPSQNRFAEDWDIPSRSAVEQNNMWQRHGNERLSENVWRNDRQPTTSSGGWQLPSDNDRYRNQQQDRSWDVRESHGNSWNSKQSPTKLCAKEPWMQNSDGNRWSSRLGNNGDNWNTRMKESLDGRKDTWTDADKPRWDQPQSNDSWNQGEKEDWNDLPEDARDPWGDEGNLGLKDRWLNDNQVASSSWSREADKTDSWMKPKDNWQNKSQTFSAKPMYQNIGNSNMNDSRWLSLNDANKKAPSTSWQGGANNVGTWQQLPSNYNFQSQRPFNINLLKDRR